MGLLLPLLLLPLTTTALTLPVNTTLLHPWQITRLSTHSPSGRPGTHPYSRLSFAIADPNTIVLSGPTPGSSGNDVGFPPSAANCTVWWMTHGEDPREGGWENTCEENLAEGMRGKWSFRVVEGSGEAGRGVTTDFGLSVTLEEAVVLGTGGVVSLKFEGEAAFKVGAGEEGNMGGSCGGSGVCNWGLKQESVPVLVKQTLVGMECVTGTCEEE
ncbi:hypothetical protein C8A01DRAFT_16624 [Parachaetomium inaequale]|uniref:Uncharacterized protein n=1 Tax=Parachaetomium inaequale TaxID=2588326 RepID=A0AAN6PEF4_9PEZI|nr:hypothetical protein C8A01DRAFT_16624 [Parachaetomium inaequale]